MNQALLSLDIDLPPSHRPASATDRTGFELGWDHAHHGLVPPAGLLLAGTPVSQGWLAGKAVFGRRTLLSTRPLRVWLRLRTEAWLAGLDFDAASITPLWLAQIEPTHCPVTRQRLGGAAGAADAPVTVMLPGPAGCVAGKLLVLSQRAAAALDKVRQCVGKVLAETRLVESGTRPALPGLNSEETLRLASLMGLSTALPHIDAARLPLRVLPPPHLCPCNVAQQLQALLTLQFMRPGWSERLRTLADHLPEVSSQATLRHDFNLFVGALAPRLLAAGPGADTRATQMALEDAWGDARVQRRWLQLALQLGAEGSALLLQRAVLAGLAAPTPNMTPSRSRDEGASAYGGAATGLGMGMGKRAGTAGRPPKNSAATSGASASWVSGPSGRNQVKVQLIMPNSSIASGV